MPESKTPAAKPAPAPVAAPAPAKRAKPVAPSKKAAVPAAAAAAKPAPADATKPAKAKEKLVRDSFTMPRSDFGLIQQLKERAMTFGHAPKKSELLRAGLHVLAALPDTRLQAVLKDLPALKSGRPRKAG